MKTSFHSNLHTVSRYQVHCIKSHTMKLFSENIYIPFFIDTLQRKLYNISVNKIRKLVNIMSTIKVDGIKKALKSYTKETGMKPFTTQIQYKNNYYEYTNTNILIRFNNNVFNTNSNIKLFTEVSCPKFPTTDHLFLKFTDDNKIQTFNTRLLLDTIRKLEKNPKTNQKETKKHRFLDYSFYNNLFTNYHYSTSHDFFRVDSYNLKTVIRIFSMLQCDKTTIIYNENHPHRVITLECEHATALLAPIRYF